MVVYKCSIHELGGGVVAADVKVFLERDGDAWHGTISVTHLANLSAGQKYRMILADGRTGEFIVRRNTFAGGAERAVAFHGAGPLTISGDAAGA